MVKAQQPLTRPLGLEAMSLDEQMREMRHQRSLAQAEIRSNQACQFAEMKRRQEEIAKARPPPKKPGPKPKNEVEMLLAQQPQTTQQVIGFHKLPVLPARTPPQLERELSEFEKLERTFPGQSSHMVGFHPDYLGERRAAVAEGRKLLTSLKAHDVVADPVLNDALFDLRSRVAQIETRKKRPPPH